MNKPEDKTTQEEVTDKQQKENISPEEAEQVGGGMAPIGGASYRPRSGPSRPSGGMRRGGMRHRM